jgi:hypothetical protein
LSSTPQVYGQTPIYRRVWNRWGTVIIDAILYLYFAVMINLRLIKRYSNKRMQQELACKGIISTPTGPLVRTWLINWLMLDFVLLTKTW